MLHEKKLIILKYLLLKQSEALEQYSNLFRCNKEHGSIERSKETDDLYDLIIRLLNELTSKAYEIEEIIENGEENEDFNDCTIDHCCKCGSCDCKTKTNN